MYVEGVSAVSARFDRMRLPGSHARCALVVLLVAAVLVVPASACAAQPAEELSSAAEIATLADPVVERLAGRTRVQTAIAISKRLYPAGASAVVIATGDAYPDALTGGSMVGRKNGVLLVTDGTKLSAAPRSWISSHRTKIYECYVFGGVKSMTPTVKNQIDSVL